MKTSRQDKASPIVRKRVEYPDAGVLEDFPEARNPVVAVEWPLAELPGLSAEDGEGLGQCGLTTTTQLRQQAATKKAQQLLAERLRVRVESVQKWVALAELSSVPSVGCQYCGLLLHAGVASVGQLAQMPLHRLHQQILRVQVAMMQRRDLCPGVEDVGRWIAEAKVLATRAR
ncbi:MAG TPA: DUF4332 domain-containing protein [Oscillatoriaceae cyanobacterium M33_DOE_052]|uniref:DUF4332 domain-containing protein n=1 Tax=Planktothricoides sp. SpSt-374 TaxID=2282167 RepID=A0A7C3VPX2_9CYAN|nr:DUF4332 domain-containing protein [Oscillatoriaceae cyanobacterium M33_DOE_052]